VPVLRSTAVTPQWPMAQPARSDVAHRGRRCGVHGNERWRLLRRQLPAPALYHVRVHAVCDGGPHGRCPRLAAALQDLCRSVWIHV
jgi:hypothetical protein